MTTMNTTAVQQKIVCVVPTRNRLSMLTSTLNAVDAQSRPPDCVVIVDNDSSDGTANWLAGWAGARKGAEVVALKENSGGAGGYHFGMKKAYELGADWIWTLDDDSVPEPPALEKLLEAAALLPDSGFFASAVLWTDGSPHIMNRPGFTGKDNSGMPGIAYASFVSLLINRRAVAAAGYPIRQFFIHCDDVEYTRRITNAGFPAFLVNASRITHATPANAGVTLREVNIMPAEQTRWEYTVRNLVAVNRRRPLGWLREPARLCLLAARLLASPTPTAVGLAVIKSGLAGLVMPYEKWIEYPEGSKNGGEG